MAQEDSLRVPNDREPSPLPTIAEEAKRNSVDAADDARWDPIAFVEMLGARAVGRINTAFPRKNGCPRQVRRILFEMFHADGKHSLER